MPHVLVAGKLHSSGIAMLSAADGFTFDYVEAISEQSYLPYLSRAEAIIIRTQPLTAAGIDCAPALRVVVRQGVGLDAIDVGCLTARGVAVATVGDVNSASVAEHAMMLLLSAAKRALRADRSVRAGDWGWRERLEATELAGKTLLIVGYGRIGQRLARMANAFQMEILAYSPHRKDWPPGPARRVRDLTSALRVADAVSLHVPRTEHPLIGAAELAAMKPGVIVVNTARAGVVDGKALVEALRSGVVAAAGIDVFAEEPPLPGDPLLAFDQVILSPHIGGLSAESSERTGIAAVRNVIDYFAGRLDPQLVANNAPPDSI